MISDPNQSLRSTVGKTVLVLAQPEVSSVLTLQLLHEIVLDSEDRIAYKSDNVCVGKL